MKDTKQGTSFLKKAVLIAFTMSLCMTIRVGAAVQVITSDHTYKSYSVNIQKGEDLIIPAADMIAYYNANETGYLNSIEKDAWFYGNLGSSISMTPLTEGAGCSFYTIVGADNRDRSVRISGTGVGCVKMTGKFNWLDKLTGTPNIIKYYNFESGIYVHVPATGIKVISNSVDDNASGIKHYMYIGSKDTFHTNVLPYNSDYMVWNKASNNAIQHIQTSSSNSGIVKLSGVGSYVWGSSMFSLEGVKEGSANVKVNSLYNTSASRDIQVNVFKKPTYSISTTSLELAKGVTVADRVYAQISNLSENNKCEIKWTSSNPALLEVQKDTETKPTLITKGTGKATLKCVITDLVAKNNKSVSPTTFEVAVVVKDDKDIVTKIITNNNSYIEQDNTITTTNEGDLFFIRVEEAGQEAGYSCTSSDVNVCTVAKSSRSGYSYQIQKKKAGKAIITVATKSGKIISFNYVGADKVVTVGDQYANTIIKKSIKPIIPQKPKISSVKVKKKKLYIVIKKSASKYKAKGFQIKVKRNGKTIINCKWKKRKLRLSNIKRHSKYVIYIRTYNGSKKSKWTKVAKKIK